MSKAVFSGFLGLFLVAGIVNAAPRDDGAYLDPPYPKAFHPLPSQGHSLNILGFDQLPSKSDTVALIDKITPIRNQSARGTCSIFSATAMLEAMMVLERGAQNNLDLSEEWLEYVVSSQTGSEGSTSNSNFAAFHQYGDVNETEMPYIGETWSTVSDSPVAQQRCSQASDQSTCLIAHRDPRLLTAQESVLNDKNSATYDPDFVKIRGDAEAFRQANLADDDDSNYLVTSQEDIKSLLAQGIPVTVDLSFYFGAWNHRMGADLGLVRDMAAWTAGIVGYPEQGSIDRAKSPTTPEGHSVLIVGYDDDVHVTTSQQMMDGSTQKFTYTGVYYFKNSWGTDNFGITTQVGNATRPGYGIITQKYANEFGTFFRMPMKAKD